MNYADIIYYDTGNSHGISTTLFVSGCDMNCPKCHNPQAQDYNFGKVFTEKEEKEILESLKNPYIDYFVLSGGQPSADKNKEVCLQLCKKIKDEVPRIKIILYTGHKVLDIDYRFYNYCDYIIDGEYNQSNVTPTLDLRGSTNQNCWEVERTALRDKSKEDKDMAYSAAFLIKRDNYFKTFDESSTNKENPIFYLVVMDEIEVTSLDDVQNIKSFNEPPKKNDYKTEEEYYKNIKDYKIYLEYLKEIGDFGECKRLKILENRGDFH